MRSLSSYKFLIYLIYFPENKIYANQTGLGCDSKKPQLKYEILVDGEDREYKKFHRTQFLRKIVLKHNMSESLDQFQPYDMTKEIAGLYSDILIPVFSKFSKDDFYSVIIASNKLEKDIFLGKSPGNEL